MPQSHDPKRSKQIKIIKQNSPRDVVSWKHSLFRASHGLMLVGGGGVQTLPLCLGTAYNVCSMEDIAISWLLCWQWKYAAQNIIHLYFKNRALAPLQIHASLCEGPIYLLLCWVITFLLKSTRWRAHCHLHSLLLIYIGYDYDWISFTMNYNV